MACNAPGSGKAAVPRRRRFREPSPAKRGWQRTEPRPLPPGQTTGASPACSETPGSVGLVLSSAGASHTNGATYTVPLNTAAGTYYICAQADSTNAVAETDETNNTLCSPPITVGVIRADLILTSLTVTPTSVVQGGSVTYTPTYKNQGNANAAGFSSSPWTSVPSLLVDVKSSVVPRMTSFNQPSF